MAGVLVMPNSIDLGMLYRLLAVVECHPAWSVELYATALGVSTKTVFNLIERARITEINVQIEREGSRKHGIWRVNELGAIDSRYARAQIEKMKIGYILPKEL